MTLRPAFPRRLLAWALLLAAPVLARADVWGYIDERGVAHFASEQVDARYELFFQGGPAGPAGGERVPVREPSVAGAAAHSPAPQGLAEASVPAVSPRLLAWLQSSPGLRQALPHLREAAQAHHLDLTLLQALVAAESGFDPQAVSPKGAIGLMQVIPATAERFGVTGDARAPVAQKLTDPRTNIRTGTRYLRHLLNLFEGKLDLALAAYNAGEGAVQRAGNRIPDFRETQNYVKTVLQIYAALKPVVAPAASAAPAAEAAPPRRVRMELPGLPGVVPGRSNMPPSLR